MRSLGVEVYAVVVKEVLIMQVPEELNIAMQCD